MAKKAKSEPEAKSEPGGFKLSAEYGNVSFGDGTCRIGLKVDRSRLSPQDADERLCGRRLTGSISCSAGNANPEQGQIFEGGAEVDGTFDVKSVGFTRKAITFGLTFSTEGFDVAALAGFAKRAGTLTITGSEDIPQGGEDDE